MSVRVFLQNGGSTRLIERLNNRVNFFSGNGELRGILQDMGKEAKQKWQLKQASFNPGGVRDLTPEYKKRKKKLVGRAYPILWLTGVMVSSIMSMVFRGPPWTVKVWHAGKHYSGMKNQELADIHAESGRDYMTLSPGFFKTWRARILRRLWD